MTAGTQAQRTVTTDRPSPRDDELGHREDQQHQVDRIGEHGGRGDRGHQQAEPGQAVPAARAGHHADDAAGGGDRGRRRQDQRPIVGRTASVGREHHRPPAQAQGDGKHDRVAKQQPPRPGLPWRPRHRRSHLPGLGHPRPY
jgi:hypothetical protein